LDENLSWNCGVEGVTTDAGVLALRRRQVRNLIATLLLSQGVAMLLAGDEFLRTQRGNNNAWCQDNELSWIDWSLKTENEDFLRFVREMIALRKRHSALRRRRFFRGTATDKNRPPDIVWHGTEPFRPDFGPTGRILAFALDGSQVDDGDRRAQDRDFYVACNAWRDALTFRIPPAPSGRLWHRIVDTALPSPEDIVPLDEGPEIPAGGLYASRPFSLIILIAQPRPGTESGLSQLRANDGGDSAQFFG